MQQAWLELANLCVTLAEKPDCPVDKKKAYFEKARDAIEHAKKLKPDDRSIIYASGVIYEKTAGTKTTDDEKIDQLRHALDEFTTGVQSETDAQLAQQIGGHIQQLRQILGIPTNNASLLGPGVMPGLPGMNVPAVGANGQANIFSHTEPSLLNQSFGNMIKLDGGTASK